MFREMASEELLASQGLLEPLLAVRSSSLRDTISFSICERPFLRKFHVMLTSFDDIVVF